MCCGGPSGRSARLIQSDSRASVRPASGCSGGGRPLESRGGRGDKILSLVFGKVSVDGREYLVSYRR